MKTSIIYNTEPIDGSISDMSSHNDVKSTMVLPLVLLLT